MDLLKDAAKNISLYDVKAYVRKAQNVAMNLTEMEAKVREATNNEPWGAPSTLMQQISAGTYNYREREEIIGLIFRRFTEKAANEWRQIYKALQLLDYLLKNGSERIIDDVRANITLIQMLKSFHYIDSKGRDQGINVRNRAKNLITFLNDDNMIRSERKKARANAKKFGGVSSAAFGGASSLEPRGASGYDDNDFSSRVYGDGGVYGARYDDPASEYHNGQSGNTNSEYEEYDPSPSTAASKPTTSSSKVNASTPTASAAPVQDLLGDLVSFDTPAGASSSANAQSTSASAANKDDDDDDDFDDFQAAPSQPQKQDLNSLYNQRSTNTSTQPVFGQTSFGSTAPQVVSAPKSNNDAFSSLFSTAKTKSHGSSSISNKKPASTATKNEDLFGDFNSNSSQQSAPTSAPALKTQGNGSNNEEIDLLSF